jgi:hypothetical protein
MAYPPYLGNPRSNYTAGKDKSEIRSTKSETNSKSECTNEQDKKKQGRHSMELCSFEF